MVLLFWVVMDAVGNLPIFFGLLSHFEPAKQRKIIMRELLIALGIMIAFLFFGHGFFKLFRISQPSLQITGGIILFMIAIKLIFSTPAKKTSGRIPKDPFIVPLAIPAIAGPGILATITLYGGGLEKNLLVVVAIIIAWALSLPPLLFAPTLKKFLGDNGLIASERLFGYIIVLLATEMTQSGILTVLDKLPK